jgi:hypothetical protein
MFHGGNPGAVVDRFDFERLRVERLPISGNRIGNSGVLVMRDRDAFHGGNPGMDLGSDFRRPHVMRFPISGNRELIT